LWNKEKKQARMGKYRDRKPQLLTKIDEGEVWSLEFCFLDSRNMEPEKHQRSISNSGGREDGKRWGKKKNGSEETPRAELEKNTEKSWPPRE